MHKNSGMKPIRHTLLAQNCQNPYYWVKRHLCEQTPLIIHEESLYNGHSMWENEPYSIGQYAKVGRVPRVADRKISNFKFFCIVHG